jgi:hypothetical protein
MDTAPSGPSGSARPVGTRSVPKAVPITVCFAGPIQGVITHRYQGKTWACPGASPCPAAIHRSMTIWKGYAPGREWDFTTKAWEPCVIEVTECLEEQLRGRQLAGEVWLLTRQATKGKSGKVVGTFLERRQDPELVLAFEILNPLRRLFHQEHFEIGVPNPLAPRLMLAPVALSGPACMAPSAVPDPRPATREQVREAFRRAGIKTRSSEQPSTNGK